MKADTLALESLIRTSGQPLRTMAAASPHARVLSIEGMNHVLKMASGSIAEQMPSYSNPHLTVAPQLIEGLSGFVRSLPRRDR